MATLRGNDGILKIGANTVAELVAWSLEQELELIEDSAMGDAAKTYKGGLSDGSGSVTLHYDPSDATGQELLVPGSTIALLLYPELDQSGDLELSFSAVITSVSRAGELNSVVSKEVGFQVSGAITENTVA